MKISDVVQLKSCDPTMTIDGFLSEEHGNQYERGLGIVLLKKTIDEDNPFAICRWFDNVSAYKIGVFRTITLEVK